MQSRLLYILWRIAHDLLNLISRAMNAFLFGGSTAQTVSARAEMESTTSLVWDKRRRIINKFFFLQKDHCLEAWEIEVARARYVLRVLGT